MRVAVAADENPPVVGAVVAALERAGAEVLRFGPPAGDGDDREWVAASVAAARAVAGGDCALGVVMCWSGTGAAIAANKVPGVRAALCGDAATARMAREYNDANVLALSLRLLSEALADEIVAAFLAGTVGSGAFNERNLAALAALESDEAASDLAWPAPTAGRPELWWDDLTVGLRAVSPTVLLTEAALIAFARRYDPQPFHTDPAAAEASVFGRLVASGWHTAAITMRLFADHGPRVHGGLVGLGVEELRWGALEPGAAVRLEAEVIERRRSRSDPGRGIVRVRVRTVAGEQEVQHFIAAILVPVRA